MTATEDKKIRTLVDQMWLLQSFMGVFSYGKKISKVIDIKESALNADSQIVDTLKFQSILIPHSRTFTFIPKYIKYFKSYENLNKKPYFVDEYWPLRKVEVIKVKRKKGKDPSANGKFNERKLLDNSFISRQHGKVSKLA